MINSTPIWNNVNEISSTMNSPPSITSNHVQLPSFKVNMETESVRSGYSDRSRSKPRIMNSVTHSASNNVLIGNHYNNNLSNLGNLSNNYISYNNTSQHNHHPRSHHPGNHNHTGGHHHNRSSSRHSHRSTRSERSNHFVISKLESPDERHEGQEVIEVQILPQDDNWGDNTTAVTGNTSDHSVSIDDINKIGKELWNEQSLALRCQMWTGTIVASIISLCAFVSPIVMIALPRIESLEWKVRLECGAECDGLLISVAFKLLILFIGSWAVFFRKPRATMPRIFVYRSVVLALIFIFMVSYWLFYAVRIADRRFAEYELSYHSIVQFAVSLVDALLFIHYLAVIFIEIRHLQPQYFVKVVRSPDGHSQCYNIGQLSIQRAAVWILEHYYQDFPIYNPYLESLPSRKNRKSSVSNQISSPGSALKYYDVDGMTNVNNNTAISGSSLGIGHANINNRSFLNSNGNGSNNNNNESRNKRDKESRHHHHHQYHNERFYEEHEYERRVKKRRARLVTATEEAFTHIKRIQDEHGPAIPMDPKEAAQAIFPSLARSLQKYLRITRQQPRHSMQSILNHLALCLSFEMSPKAFLEKYLVANPVLQNDNEHKPIQTWGLICDIMLSRSIEPGVTFMLRQGDVALLVTVNQLPHFNITEEVIDPKSNKFVFRMNSETSV